MIFNFMIYLANTDSDPLKNIKISSLSELQTFLETKNDYTQFINKKLKKDYFLGSFLTILFGFIQMLQLG